VCVGRDGRAEKDGEKRERDRGQTAGRQKEEEEGKEGLGDILVFRPDADACGLT
jgi:hypothetical protein